MCYKCFNATNIAYFATFYTVKNVVSLRAMALAMALAMPALALALALAFDFRLSTFDLSICRSHPTKKNRPEGRFF